MLGRSSRKSEPTDYEGAGQPLLNDSHEDLPLHANGHDQVLFSVQDDDDDDDLPETSALEAQTSPNSKSPKVVRFQEEVQVVAPSLRSTASSREAGE